MDKISMYDIANRASPDRFKATYQILILFNGSYLRNKLVEEKKSQFLKIRNSK